MPDPGSRDDSRSAASLLRAVGLLPDGPVLWGRPLSTRKPGLYLVELTAPLPAPPIELTKVGKWIESLPELRLDRTRPTSKALAARLAALWLPSEVVLYAGATTGSLGARVHSLTHHVLGERRPHADGHWLQLLTGLERTRIWFAETAAAEEHLDALLDAFAAGAGANVPPGRPADALLLPWANLRRPTGERQATGLSGSLVPEEPSRPTPPTRVVDVAAGDAEGARPEPRNTGTTRRTQKPVLAPASRSRATTPKVVPPSQRIEPVPLTRDALARLEAELDEMTRVRRPDVVARIKSARELGDLKENAEYQAAREEQSFLEGRIRLLEERKRHAVITEEDVVDGRAHLGSTVVVEIDGDTTTYVLVGSTEADPAAGRLSVASPVGAALLGTTAGAEVDVKTPRGSVRYRVAEVR